MQFDKIMRASLSKTEFQMTEYINGIVLILFIGFMIFIFGGYHKTKSSERESKKKTKED